MIGLARAQYEAALRAVDETQRPVFEQVAMLVEIAMGLQNQARAAEDFQLAVALYQRALDCAVDEPALERARIQARQATALGMDPAGGQAALEQARELLELAGPILSAQGEAAEAAEAQLNLGLVLQSLAGLNAAPLSAAIAAYQRALRGFSAAAYPAEFAVLQNNLATAYLALAGGGPEAKVREALAVQAFESALQHISLIEHPREYAMLQNNLGNALQYAASGHPLENNVRALAAYDEALKVRTARDSPLEYANTLANLANCLGNLPDAVVSFDRVARQSACLDQAREIFRSHGLDDKAELLAARLAELAADAL